MGHQIDDGPADQVGPFSAMRISKGQFETALKRYDRPLLTFDDGFAANIDYVVETADRNNISVLIFLTTGFINRAVEPYELQLAALLSNQAEYDSIRLPLKTRSAAARRATVEKIANGSAPKVADDLYLTWEKIRELDALEHVEFGAHSVNHLVLSRISPFSAWREIRESKREIETRLGHPIEAFAYPYGQTSPLVTVLVRLAGFKRAFVTDRGTRSRFRIGRIDLNHAL